MGKQFLHAVIEGRYADAVRFFGELSPRDLSTTPERGMGSVIPTRVYYFAATATGAEEQARNRALAAIARANNEQREHRNEWRRLARLALEHVYAGIPDEARRFAARSLELMSVKRDALDGTRALYENACTYLALGDLDRALTLLEELMMLPNDVIANEVLYLEPWWKPLHDNPRFKAALAKAAPRD